MESEFKLLHRRLEDYWVIYKGDAPIAHYKSLAAARKRLARERLKAEVAKTRSET